MPGELTSGIGLDIVIWLQDHGNGVFDLLAKTLHFCGRSTFFLLVLTLLYWSVNKHLGLRLLFVLLVGTLFNTVLKEIIQDPRPFQLHPDQVEALVTGSEDCVRSARSAAFSWERSAAVRSASNSGSSPSAPDSPVSASSRGSSSPAVPTPSRCIASASDSMRAV